MNDKPSPDGAPTPERVFAVQADQEAAVLPRGRVNVKTRLAIDMAPGVSLKVEPHPGSPAGLFVAAGPVPPEHRGTLFVTLANFTEEPFLVHPGTVIAVCRLSFGPAPANAGGDANGAGENAPAPEGPENV